MTLYQFTRENAVRVFEDRWSASGYPSIRISHRLAASFMLTRGDTDPPAPWGCFEIVLPPGLLPTEHRRILVMHGSAGHWQWMATDGETVIARQASTALDDECPADPLVPDAARRCMRFVNRLIASVCTEIVERYSDRITTVKRGKKKLRNKKPRTVIHLNRPVIIDWRQEVTRYLAGGGSPPTTRWMVMGHWRSQPCGPRGLERKMIWIEPHWSSRDESLPVARRHHVLIDRQGREHMKKPSETFGLDAAEVMR